MEVKVDGFKCESDWQIGFVANRCMTGISCGLNNTHLTA